MDRQRASDGKAVKAPMRGLASLPVFFDLAGRRVLLAGGSARAAWKAELLQAAGARVDVFCTEPAAELVALAAKLSGSSTHRAALAAGRFQRRGAGRRRFSIAAGGGGLSRGGAARPRSGQSDRPAGILRFSDRHDRRSLAARHRHFDQGREPRLCARLARLARSAAASSGQALGGGRRKLARETENARPLERGPAALSGNSSSPRRSARAPPEAGDFDRSARRRAGYREHAAKAPALSRLSAPAPAIPSSSL